MVKGLQPYTLHLIPYTLYPILFTLPLTPSSIFPTFAECLAPVSALNNLRFIMINVP